MKFINESVDDVLKPKSEEEVKHEISKFNFFTVGDLKKLLQNIPDYLPVGINGHFGEFYPMDKSNFLKTISHPVPINKGWRNMLNMKMPIFEITSPYIGEEPD